MVIELNRQNKKINIQNIFSDKEQGENEFKNILLECFNNEAWLQVFLKDDHHGFIHGNQVRLSCLKLINNLTDLERNELLKEAENVADSDREKYVKLIIEIAAIFHDSGRFNEEGVVMAEEQKLHHILSAKRAEIFCIYLGLDNLIPFIEEAILCHDFQSAKLTPDLKSPKNMSGKIVQAADQMGWFHPDSLERTLNFNKTLGLPFYNKNVNFNERIIWRPGNICYDAFTVMLCQLFGPTGKDRFGTEYAKLKVETYKKDLEVGSLKIANENGFAEEVSQQINQAKQNSYKTF